MVVNTGCGPQGCNGHVGYDNGWPHPLRKEAEDGPGSCPNGLLADPSPWSNIGAVYCYTSLEETLQDHAAPPFLQLSPSGWATPPN